MELLGIRNKKYRDKEEEVTGLASGTKSKANEGGENSAMNYEIKKVDEKLKKDISNIQVRTAKKYVYFDSETGAVKFEYGGVAQCMNAIVKEEKGKKKYIR